MVIQEPILPNFEKQRRGLSNPFRGVGKWKIRKQISGGADAHMFTVKYGEPGSKQNYDDYSQRKVFSRSRDEVMMMITDMKRKKKVS